MVVAQLVEWLLRTPEAHGSNPLICKSLYWTFVYSQLYLKDKNKENEAGWNSFKSINLKRISLKRISLKRINLKRIYLKESHHHEAGQERLQVFRTSERFGESGGSLLSLDRLDVRKVEEAEGVDGVRRPVPFDEKFRRFRYQGHSDGKGEANRWD